MRSHCSPLARRRRSNSNALTVLPWLALCLATTLLTMPTWAQEAAAEGIAVAGVYFEDASDTYNTEQALERLRSAKVKTLSGMRFNDGNRDTHYWLLLRIQNTAADAQTLLLDTGVPYRAVLKALLLRSGAVGPHGQASVILATDDSTTFEQRHYRALHLHSAPFSVPGNSSAEILLEYRTRGSTYMPLSVKSPALFRAQQTEKQLGAAVFFTACTVLLLIFALQGWVLKEVAIILYVGLFYLALLFIAAVEGYGFQYLWPHAPLWNQYASLVLWLGSIGASLLIAVYTLDAKSRNPLLDRALLALGALALVLAATCRFLPFSSLINVASILTLLASLGYARTVASWVKHSPRRHFLALLSIVAIVPFAAALVLLAFLDFDIPDLVFLYGHRALFVFAIGVTLASLAIHLMSLRREHEDSLQVALDAAHRDARMSRALLEAEQKYMHAKQLAQQHQVELANTSHDIRQPLVSLRATMHSLPLAKDSAEWLAVKQALDYIERISRPHGATGTGNAVAAVPQSTTPNAYRADLLLQTLVQMFDAEARDRKIVLRFVPCSILIQREPLQLMRILSNLVSNALAHCPHSRVLLGCRRQSHAVRFDVIDNGPGLSATELTRVITQYEKGKESSGEGLGLSICWALAKDNGMHMEAESTAGRGSRFSVLVPLC